MKSLIKSLLNEQLFDKSSKKQTDLLNTFVEFACQFLKIDVPQITLKFDHNGLVTTAAYGDNKVLVYAHQRATIDIMRSIAHELTHAKQDVEKRLKGPEDGNDGSDIENEANATAGIIIRKFGKLHPEVYI